PPTRVSLTLPAIRSAAEVWLLASGEAKAEAVRLALAPEAGPVQVPAAGARGRSRTLLLVDPAAAARLPGGLTAPGLLSRRPRRTRLRARPGPLRGGAAR